MRRSVLALAVAGVGLTAGLALAPPALAAPYAEDPVIEVSTSNPVVGGTLTLTVSGFLPAELVDLVLHSTPFPLGTVTANNQGTVSTLVDLPDSFTCRHHITATGRSSGEVARTDLVIGDLAACSAAGGGSHGNSGSGNTGSGNRGNGNIGHGNTGSGNVGHGNTGNGNGGSGDTPFVARYGPDGDPGGYGPSSVASSTYTLTPVSSASSTLAAGTVAATAVLGGVLFLTRRRPLW